MVLFLIVYIIYIVYRMMESMHMLQQNLYNENNRYLRWITKNITKVFCIFDFIPIIFFVFLFFLKDKQIMDFVLVASMFVYMYGIYNEYRKNRESQNKIPLKVTSRIKRLFFTVILIIGIFLILTVKAKSNNITVIMLITLSLLLGFIYFVVYLANIIDAPLNKLEYLFYFNKAKKKLNERNDLIKIGITGSYGKTSSKNILNDILGSKYITRQTPKNYNTPYGIMMTINNNLDKFDNILITEMGAYTKGDIKKICDFINPKYGILTIIGDAHLETFGTKENIVSTKFELIESLPEDGLAVLNMDDEYQTSYKLKNKVRVKWISIKNNKADYYATNIKNNNHGMSFDVHFNNEKINMRTRILGIHNVYNILSSIALAIEMGVSKEDIKASILSLKPIEHRLELKKMGNFYMLDDAYNSNPIGAANALDTLNTMNGTKVVVTPGMVELGKVEKEKNYEFGKKISSICEYCILIGEKRTKVIKKALLDNGFNEDNIFVVNNVVSSYKIIEALKEENKDIYALFENDLPDIYTEDVR